MNDTSTFKDVRHRKFAEWILKGETPPQAYRKAGYKAKSAHARQVCASRLLLNVGIATYLREVRQAAEAAALEGTVLSVVEKRQFLARIVRTPVMAIDPHDPERRNGDLISSYQRIETEAGGHEKIVKLCPLKAIAEDNRLSGDDPEANAAQAMAEAFAQIAAKTPTLPDDRM